MPYGEVTDDWTQIDRRWSSESGTVNVPLSNKNLFGFVEISDPNGDTFEETASREGLIENNAFRQLTDYIHKALSIARNKITKKITQFKTESNEDDYTQKTINEERTEKELVDTLVRLFTTDNNNEFDESYTGYLQLQADQGFDLTQYKGRRVKRYTYQLTNYPSQDEPVQISLLIYKNRVVGGQIQSSSGSFLHGLSLPGPASAQPSPAPSQTASGQTIR